MDEPNMRASAAQLCEFIYEAFRNINFPPLSRDDLSDIQDALSTFATTIEAEATERAARIADARHEHWSMPHPDDAEPGEVCCDVTACRDIAAAIRSSTGDPKARRARVALGTGESEA